MRIVMARGTASARAEGQGAMVAVQASLDIVEAALRGEPDLTIAAYNGPADFVLSGAPEAARRLVARFESEGRKARLLNIPFGSHSRFVEPAIPELEAALRRATYASASLPIAANLSGALAAPAPPQGFACLAMTRAGESKPNWRTQSQAASASARLL